MALLRRLSHPTADDPRSGPLPVVVAPVRSLLQRRCRDSLSWCRSSCVPATPDASSPTSSPLDPISRGEPVEEMEAMAPALVDELSLVVHELAAGSHVRGTTRPSPSRGPSVALRTPIALLVVAGVSPKWLTTRLNERGHGL
jgi:hypothetical protein